MKRIGQVGLAVVVLCSGVGVASAANDKVKAKDNYDYLYEEPAVAAVEEAAPVKAEAKVEANAEPKAEPKEETTGASMSVTGEVVLRQTDAKHKNVVYLRMKDSTDRVYLVQVDGTTALSGATMDTLAEGMQVSASFPRGGESVPVATSISLVQ